MSAGVVVQLMRRHSRKKYALHLSIFFTTLATRRKETLPGLQRDGDAVLLWRHQRHVRAPSLEPAGGGQGEKEGQHEVLAAESWGGCILYYYCSGLPSGVWCPGPRWPKSYRAHPILLLLLLLRIAWLSGVWCRGPRWPTWCLAAESWRAHPTLSSGDILEDNFYDCEFFLLIGSLVC